MRVLHVTRDFPPRVNGGISTAVGGAVSALARDGVHCAVVSFDGWRPLRGPARSKLPEVRSSGDVARVRTDDHLLAASALARRFKPDVVHVHHGMLWQFGRKIADESGAATAFTVHVAQAHQQLLRGIEDETMSLRAQRLAIGEASIVMVPSKAVLAALSRDKSATPKQVMLVPLAAALPALTIERPRVPGRFLYVGRFADVNGTDVLFDVFESLSRSVPGATFHIAGGLPDNPKAEKKWHRRFASRASAELLAATTFCGWLSPGELEHAYQSASVLILPSVYETFGLVAVEAMLRELPIAATEGGALSEILEHDRTALLSPVGDVDALADSGRRLAQQSALARRLARAAREQSEGRYVWERAVPVWRRAYAIARDTAGA